MSNKKQGSVKQTLFPDPSSESIAESHNGELLEASKAKKRSKDKARSELGSSTGEKGKDSDMSTFVKNSVLEDAKLLMSADLYKMFESYGDRFVAAVYYMSLVEDLTVTDDCGVSVSAIVWNTHKTARYAVNVDSDALFCSCADNKFRKSACKHILASLLKALKLRKIAEYDIATLIGRGDHHE